jgi:hypothetical protein
MNQTRTRPKPSAPPARALIRAEILDVIDDDTALVRASGSPTAEVVRAEIAVLGYSPAVGDRVLVERGEDGWFILGILGAARRRSAERDPITLVRTETGVEIRVAEGDLTLSALGRVVLRASEVETSATLARTTASEVVTSAGRVEVEAKRVVERAGDVYRHVEGLAELQAGRARTLVEGAYQLAAKRTTVQSDEDTIIDGKRVLLG